MSSARNVMHAMSCPSRFCFVQRTPPAALTGLHLISTWFMVGLIWTIHTVHYPLFAHVGSDSYVEFQASHVDRIGKLLLVPWAAEGATALLLLIWAWRQRDQALLPPLVIGGLAMGVVLVVSGFFSAPAHADLANGFVPEVHDRLMKADLVRTLAWTLRGVTAAWVSAVIWKRRTA
jgi:hypothetical protein